MGSINTNPNHNTLLQTPVAGAQQPNAASTNTPIIQPEPTSAAQDTVKNTETEASAADTKTPDLVISKEMAASLSSKEIQGLIDDILADGKVSGTDNDKLTELNNLLKMAAQKNDGKIDSAEDSLLDAVDSRGFFGTNKDVVKSNLQALKKIHVNEANELSFEGVGLTTQDGVSGFFGGKQVRALTLLEGVVLKGPSESEGQGEAQENASAMSSPLSDAAISRKARESLIAPVLEKNEQNESKLKESLAELKGAINERVSTDVIKNEIQNLVKHSVSEGELDLPFVLQQAKAYGISLSSLTQSEQNPEGVLTQAEIDNPAEAKLSGSQISKLNQHFKDYQPTEQNISAYKNDLTQVIDRALSASPLKGEAYQQLKTHLYDKNYIFENNQKSGVSAEQAVSSKDQALYADYKTQQENYEGSQKSSQLALENVDKPVALQNIKSEASSLERSSNTAEAATTKTIADIEKMLTAIEGNPKQFGEVDTQKLRADLQSLTQVDAQGKSQVKTPMTQDHLDTINQVWSSLEEVGMKSGVAQNKGEIAAGYLEKNPAAAQALQQTEAGKLLASKPELAQYTGLLNQLDKPENAALKNALFGSENPEEAVSKLLADHNAAQFKDLLSGFGSWSICGISPSIFGSAGNLLGGPVGGVVGGALDSSIAEYCSPVSSSPFTADFSLESDLPEVSLSLSEPSKMLNLGGFSTSDVRDLLNLVKGSDTTSQQLRADLSQNSSALNEVLAQEGMQGLQEQFAVKEQFDKVFWGDNSQLEKTQLAIETSVNQQSKVASDLAVATAHVEQALATSPDDESTRKGLQQQLALLKSAQDTLATTGSLPKDPFQQQQLQKVMDIVGNEGVTNGPALWSLAKSQGDLAELMGAMAPLQETMRNASPEELQRIFSQFPPEQAAQIENMLKNQEVLGGMAKILMSEKTSPELAKNIKATLMSFSQAVQLAQNGDKEALQALGNKPMNADNPHSPSLFSNLEQMSSVIEHVNQFSDANAESKGLYAAGLTDYLFGEQSQGVPLDKAWSELKKDNVVAKTILGKMEEVYGSENMDVFKEQLQGRVNTLGEKLKDLQKTDPHNTLLSSVNLGTPLSYDKLGDLSENDYKDLVSNLETKLKQTGISASDRVQLTGLHSALTEAQNIQKASAASSKGSSFVSSFQAFVKGVEAKHTEVSQEAESFIQTNASIINTAVPKSEGVLSTQVLFRELGKTVPDMDKVRPILAALSAGSSDDKQLARNIWAQFQKVTAVNIQAKIPSEILAQPQNEGVSSTFAFGNTITNLSDWATNLKDVDVDDALGEVDDVIAKYRAQIIRGRFDSEAFLAEIAVLQGRYNNPLSPQEKSAVLTFQGTKEQVDGLQEGVQHVSSADMDILQKDVDELEHTVTGNLTAIADDQVSVFDFSQGFTQGNPVFEAKHQETLKSFQEADFAEMVSANASATMGANQILQTVFAEAEKNNDFSLAHAMRQDANVSNRSVMSMYDSSLQGMSETTGVPYESQVSSSGASGVSASRAASEQKASQLVEEANELASRLVLAPKGQDSEDFLNELVSEFLNVIRDQDYKTRQLVLAQLANQMMTDSITNFYKDKTDKNNKYHQDSLNQMSESFQRNIQLSIQDSLVNSAEGGDAQSVAAVSGQVGAASTAKAMGVAQLRVSAEQLLSQAQQMEPPLLSDLQKERILDSLFDRNPDNDALGIMALAGLQSLN